MQQIPGMMSADICVAFATTGRAEVLRTAIDAVSRQTMAPRTIIISCVNDNDALGASYGGDMRIYQSRPGLPIQRNVALDHLPSEAKYVIFFDDDFLPHPMWIEAVVDVFKADPAVAGITGSLLADGITGPGISQDEANRLISAAETPQLKDVKETPYSPYGCNMAFRIDSLTQIRFDERLVLYGWQEDRDFGSQLRHAGHKVIKISTALGVHLGVKSGRVSGVKLGYSQIANPLYLWKKGTMAPIDVARHVSANVLKNLARSLKPEPHIDRLGRFRGNLRGFLDLILGCLAPEKALDQ